MKIKTYFINFSFEAKKQNQVTEPGSDKPKIVVKEKLIEHPLEILDI